MASRDVPPVWTVGHSTRPIEEFIALLAAHGVTQLVDVRAQPMSRRNPQFNVDQLPASLAASGIAHVSLRELGGLRRPRPDSVNKAWRNASFRGYADYMQTPEFAAGLRRLMELARDAPTAIMCAEAVPWRCHRSLIADALVARGGRVLHILGAPPPRPHSLVPFARVEDEQVTYPAAELFDGAPPGDPGAPTPSGPAT